MTTDWRKLLPVASSLCFSFVHAAEEKTKDAAASSPATSPAWETRVLRLPRGFWWQIPPSSGFGPSGEVQEKARQAPAPLPPENATDAEWCEHLKKSTSAFCKWLEEYGVDCPEGTVMLHDAESGTLAVRTTRACMGDIAFLADAMVERLPIALTFSLDVVEADAAIVRRWAGEAMGQPSHTRLWSRVQEKMEKREVKPVTQLRLEGRNGRWCKAASAGNGSAVSLAIEPMMYPDNSAVTFELRFQYQTFSPDASRQGDAPLAKTPADASAPPICVRLSTGLTLRPGMSRLLTTWTPAGDAGPGKAAVMQAAFLRAEVKPLLPPPHARLASMLARHLGTAGPLPAKASTPARAGGDPEDLPAGMIVRRISGLPSDIFTGGFDVEPPQAPASPEPSGAGNGARLRPRVLPVDLLKTQGIDFPAGARATYEVATRTLEVVNTPQNAALAEQYFAEGCILHPQLVGHTIHIVEADGAMLRALLQEARGDADHTPLWHKLNKAAGEGKARLLRTVFLESRNGQEARFEAGSEHPRDEAGPSITTNPGGPEEDSPGAQRTPWQTQIAGTTFVTTPVMDPSGWNVDVEFDLTHHYLEPAKVSLTPGSGANAASPPSSSLIFHDAHAKGSALLSRGMTRLLSVWRPEGAPSSGGKDVLQAAFLVMNIAHLDGSPEPDGNEPVPRVSP